jgi:electron transfer flavoprotein beta subunit
VLSLGGTQVQTTIRNALAMGADRAIHLKTEGGAPDPLQVARALAAEIQALDARIVWFGKQAVDDDAAQVGPMVAELLEMPCVTVVASFELKDGAAAVEREIEGGREVIDVTLPAVLTAEKGLNEPRYASLKGIMAAKKKPIDEKPAALGPPALEIVSLALPSARAPGRVVGQGVAAVPELVRLLREEAKVI